jgi:uncharacterized membrane protein
MIHFTETAILIGLGIAIGIYIASQIENHINKNKKK